MPLSGEIRYNNLKKRMRNLNSLPLSMVFYLESSIMSHVNGSSPSFLNENDVSPNFLNENGSHLIF